MGLRPHTAFSPCTRAGPRRGLEMLLLPLLLTTLLPFTSGESKRNLPPACLQLWLLLSLALGEAGKKSLELRCLCVKTVSGIHPSNIQNLEVMGAGAHCSQVEVIATLKNGKEVCLDPEAPVIKKIVQKILEDDRLAN
ncbi:platelet basic protein [Sorex araneus]|uniref:platelet basic protein n=1 Tax=Sorex araneus TaxID=42254 RepID=UPI002433951A|nr:platelet basic protein [Sorex araneus]